METKHRIILRAGALIYGLVIMSVVQILLVSIIKYSLQIRSKEQTLQIAEAGINFYRWYLAHNVEGRTASQIDAFWSGSAYGVGTPYEVDYSDPAGGVIGRYRLEVTPPSLGTTSVIVKSTGWTYKYPNMQRIVQVRLRKPSWSEYAVLANDFLRFGTGSEVFGPIHSNYGIRFDGLAHHVVSSSVYKYNDPDHTGGDEFGVHTHTAPIDPLPVSPALPPSRADVFEAGRVLEASTADFSGVLSDLNLMKSIAQANVNGSRYFDNAHQGRHVILNSNDTFDIRTVQSFTASTNEINNYSGNWSNYAIPDNGVIYVENNVWLEGTVDGRRVTIVAANLISSAKKTMYLGKDVRYTNYDCTDMIGLVGQNDVEVYRQSNNILRIDAALIAQSGRVGRSNYTGPYAIRDTITIFGSIVSNQRYGFAWADIPGNHVSGYQNRNITYDNNLLYCPPPYFPTGTQYELDLWEEL
jgi:hypothetical protein